jgi:hypothetical protein
MTITLQDLKDKGACSSQVILFEATFGDHVRVTKRLLLKWRHKFNLEWMATHYLTGERRGAFNTAAVIAGEAYVGAWFNIGRLAEWVYDRAVAVALWEQIKNET